MEHVRKSDNKIKGNLGEKLAAELLERKGYVIVARQWRCSLGEIDLIADDRGTLVFVEVKTRRGGAFGPPELSVHGEKARRMQRLADYYVASTHTEARPQRIDLVAIELANTPGQAVARHHRDIISNLPYVDSRRRRW